jgi:hypothetical protein
LSYLQAIGDEKGKFSACLKDWHKHPIDACKDDKIYNMQNTV